MSLVRYLRRQSTYSKVAVYFTACFLVLFVWMQTLRNSSAENNPTPSILVMKQQATPSATAITSSTITVPATVDDLIPADFRGSGVVKYMFSENLKAEGDGFYLITMLNLFTGQEIWKYDQETVKSKRDRNWEYLSVVRENINHPHIKRIIYVYTDTQSLNVLLRQNWPNITKVYPMRQSRLLHMVDFFQIAGQHLLNEPVIGCNGDIVIGDNFDKIDVRKLREEKILYTLTRHANKGLGDCKPKSMCLSPYHGSHDTHIFSLREPVTDEAAHLLDYPVNLGQAENAMQGIMHGVMGFSISNPCKTLTTYHVHCSQVAARLLRGENSVRQPPYSMGSKYIKLSPPTDKL